MNSEASGYSSQYRLKKGLFLLAVFFAVTVAAYVATAPAPAPDVMPSPLHVSAESLAFGTAWAQPKFEWRLPIRNTSDRPVSVTSIRSSCKCSAVEPNTFCLAPGGAIDVKVTMDLMPGTARDASAQTRPFSVTLVPMIKTSPGLVEQAKWELRGSVSQMLTLRPASFYFGENLVHGLPFAQKSVQVESQIPLRSLEASLEANPGRVSVSEVADDGRHFRVDLNFSEDMSQGPFEFEVFLTAATSYGEQLPRMPVAVSGRVFSDIQAFPRELNLGERQLNSAFAAQLELRSLLGIRFRLLDVACSDEMTRDEPLPAGASTKHVVDLVVTPKQAGHQHSIVRIAAEVENRARETITVAVRWYAVDPRVVVDVPFDQVTTEVSL